MTTYYNYRGAAMAVSQDGGSNVVNGSSDGNETLHAAPGPSIVSSNGGPNDLMIGNTGDVTFYVGNPTDVVQVPDSVATGVNTIVAYTHYTLPANVQNLTFYGGGSWGVGNNLDNLIVMGGNDADYLDGGAGNDVLVGGFGQNTFQAAVGNGNDVIYNFHANQDIVRLPGASFTSFSQIQAAMTQVGPDVVLKIDPSETLTFRGVSVADFHASNFLMPLDTSKLGALTFDDEFNTLQTLDYSTGTGHWQTNLGGSPNSQWTYEIQGNSEQQVYADPNFRGQADYDLGINPFSVNNGILTITAQKLTADQANNTWGQQYSSGMLTTKGVFMQQYGYFDMRAELPTAAGTWPAFWLSQDPFKGGAEADIMEHLASSPNISYSRAYYGSGVNAVNAILDNPSGFHDYSMLWTPTTTTFYIDNYAIMQVATPANWDKPMYMLLNLALGGWAGNVDPSGLPAQMNVDYVRVYGLADNSQITENLTPQGPAGTLTASGSAIALSDSTNWTDAKILDDGQMVLTSSVGPADGGRTAQATIYDTTTGAEQHSPISLYGFASGGQTMDPVITTMDGSFWRVDFAGPNAPGGWQVYDGQGDAIFFKNDFTDGNAGFTPLANGSAVLTNSARSNFAVYDSAGVFHVHDLPTVNGVMTQPSEVHALSNGDFYFTYAGQSQIDVFNADGSVDTQSHLGAPVSSFAMGSDAMTNGQFAVAWLSPQSADSNVMNLTFQTFDSTGQSLAQSQTVATDADPWHTELKVLATGKNQEALMLWSQGGAIHAAFAHGSVIDAPVALMVGNLDDTHQTALTDGSFLLTWLQTDNGVQDLWAKSIDPYTMQGTTEELGPADGQGNVVALAHGAYAVSWHTGGQVEARAYDGEGHIGAITTVAGDFIGADASGDVVALYHDASGAALMQHYAMTDYFSVSG